MAVTVEVAHDQRGRLLAGHDHAALGEGEGAAAQVDGDPVGAEGGHRQVVFAVSVEVADGDRGGSGEAGQGGEGHEGEAARSVALQESDGARRPVGHHEVQEAIVVEIAGGNPLRQGASARNRGQTRETAGPVAEAKGHRVANGVRDGEVQLAVSVPIPEDDPGRLSLDRHETGGQSEARGQAGVGP